MKDRKVETRYSQLANAYRWAMRATGFTSSLRRYISRLPLDLPACPRVVEVGCGTGDLSLALAERFGAGWFLATDLEDKFLIELARNASALKASVQFHVGKADINSPETVRAFDTEKPIALGKETFDVVIVGAALGYARSLEDTIAAMLGLLKNGGYFIDIEMAESISGILLSRFFHYRRPTTAEIIATLARNGCGKAEKIPFKWKDGTAGFSRVGIVARKGVNALN